jgi:outer membrane cobalamin receptor
MRVSGYAVVNLRTNITLSPSVDMLLRINNVFDCAYATGAR